MWYVSFFVLHTGCTGLISAGYKITWDKGAEGEEEEGAEQREVRDKNVNRRGEGRVGVTGIGRGAGGGYHSFSRCCRLNKMVFCFDL